MDWSKAKNILIGAFIVLNIYLVFQVFNLQEPRIPVSEYTSVNEQVTSLIIEKYKVEPPAELPLGIFPVGKPNVVYSPIDQDKIVNSLWPKDEGNWVAKGVYIFNDEYLYVNDQMFYYLNEAGDVREIDDDETIRYHLSLALIDPANIDIVAPILRVSLEEVTALDFNGWLLESISETVEDDTLYYDILFIQELGLPVYDSGSYTKIRINEKGHIIGIKRAELEIKEQEKNFVEKIRSMFAFSTKVKIISATEALLSLVANKDLEPDSVIKDIRLAYLGLAEDQFPPDELLPAQPAEIVWELIPVWRLKVMNPQNEVVNYYLNAYTGTIEQ